MNKYMMVQVNIRLFTISARQLFYSHVHIYVYYIYIHAHVTYRNVVLLVSFKLNNTAQNLLDAISSFQNLLSIINSSLSSQVR